MRVREVMSTPVVTVPPVVSVQEAARHMDYSGVGSLIVTDDERVVGIVTDRDLVLRVLARELPGQIPISRVMSTDVIAVAPGDDIDAAVHAFRTHPVRRLPVIDDDVVVGMITIDDLLLRSQHLLTDLLGPVSNEILEPQHAEE